MKVLINDIGGDVRTETKDGKEWLVAPVTLMKSMNLDGGYVPENQVKKSALAWNGIPITLNHPQNANGELVSANSPDVAEKTWLGHIFNVKPSDPLTGEAWYDLEKVNRLGGKAGEIVERLENDETIEVSTSYFGDQLPPGEYDGEFRQNVVGNLRPDHLASLPNKEGRCSIADGCGVGEMAANTQMFVTPTDDPTGEVMGDNDNANPVAEAFNTLWNAVGKTQNEGAESSAGTHEIMSDLQDKDIIEELAENAEFDRENLEKWDGTDCLQNLYDDYQETEEAAKEPETNEESETVTNDDTDDPAVTFETQEEFEAAVQDIVSNEQAKNEKKQTVDRIIDNHSDYSEDDRDELLETNQKVLEGLADAIQPQANFAAQRGASPEPSTNDADTEGLKIFGSDE